MRFLAYFVLAVVMFAVGVVAESKCNVTSKFCKCCDVVVDKKACPCGDECDCCTGCPGNPNYNGCCTCEDCDCCKKCSRKSKAGCDADCCKKGKKCDCKKK